MVNPIATPEVDMTSPIATSLAARAAARASRSEVLSANPLERLRLAMAFVVIPAWLASYRSDTRERGEYLLQQWGAEAARNIASAHNPLEDP